MFLERGHLQNIMNKKKEVNGAVGMDWSKSINQGDIGGAGKKQLLPKIIFIGLMVLLVWAPLPAASVYEWTILFLEVAVLLLLGLYAVGAKQMPWFGTQRGALFGAGEKVAVGKPKLPGLLFALFVAYMFVQVAPLPGGLVRLFSRRSVLQGIPGGMLSPFSGFQSLSILPSATVKLALQILAYILVGYLVIRIVRLKKPIFTAFYVIVLSGIFQAFYGIFELYSKSPRILFYKKTYGLGSVTGTFVNRNHLSGFLEMAIPLAIGLVIARIDLFSMAKMKWRQKILYMAEKGMARNLLLVFGILVMALAVIFSKSRSGVFILIMTFLMFFEMTVLFSRETRRRKRWTRNFLAVTFIGLTFLSLYIGIDAVLARFSRLQDQSRIDVWNNTVQIIGDYPVFGTGLGTFQWMLPLYEKHWQKAHFTYAHNDYLEYLSELGIVGFGLLVGGILFMLVKSFLIWRERRRHWVKGLAMGGIVAVVNMLIHSITDFNLHIPANMLLFAAVLALTWVTVHYKYEPRGRKQSDRS